MILDLFRLDGRVALVTGAGQGLGQAMAIGLAEAGADIVALDRRESDQTGQAVTALGRRFKSITCDLCDGLGHRAAASGGADHGRHGTYRCAGEQCRHHPPRARP